MDRPIPGYREAAPPPPRRFALRMGATARAGLAVSALALTITVALWLATGRLFLLFVVAFGPGVYYLLSGAPRAIEVSHHEVVIRSWLRPPRRLATRDLSVLSSEREIVLVTPDDTIAIATEHFPGDELERFLGALRGALARDPATPPST